MLHGLGDNRAMEAPPELVSWIERQLHGDRFVLNALAAEASTRRFYRVAQFADNAAGGSRFIAMYSPPETENNPRYVRLAGLFRCFGLATPTIHAADLDRGFLLVEDLGERDFESAYAAGQVAEPLEAALQALVSLQKVPGDAIPPYTPARFLAELGIFTDWLVGRFLGLDVPSFFGAVREALIEATQSVPQRAIHRDYHCRNLIWRLDGSVGIVDFQDALFGPSCYDIASLLRDCYHEFDEANVWRWRRRFFDLAGLECSPAAFERSFDLTAVQRQLKAVGIFARLYLSRGKRSHLHDIVPVLRRLARLGSAYDETAALAAWIDGEVLPRAVARLGELAS